MPANQLTIALTGGIASGKSTVAQLFAEHGITVVDADLIAHQLTEPDSPLLPAITSHFGEGILEAGALNRSKLAEIIFQQPAARQWLNQLLHPAIRIEMQRQLNESQSPYSIAVIPLLAESTGIDFIDRVLVVDIPEALQLERLMNRDKLTQADALLRINAQASRKQRLAIADDVILNQSDLAALQQQVAQLHQQYLNNR